mgnify:CR=1 FL=1|jgi:hypothetical protein
MYVDGEMWFNERTQAIAPIHTEIAISEHKKKKPGTRIILLVPAKKSAAASITSMAFLRESKLQAIQQQKAKQKKPTTAKATRS